MNLRRNVPPPIPIPINPIQAEIEEKTPTPNTLPVIALELSNYPPNLTRQEIQELFEGFVISLDFVLLSSTRFVYPFRTCIWMTGDEEARRAVKELSGKTVGGRQIRLTMVDSTSYEQKEVVVDELADGLKIAISNAARIYDPNLVKKILEVREHVEGASYFAFLQSRDPVTTRSDPEANFQSVEDTAEWELVAGSCFNGLGVSVQDKSIRLAALKRLEETVEQQGMCKKTWGKWKGSSVLDLDV
ncbi:hypothetical protein GQ44DRAFT_740561 [Phaeosphaeriaceae sp. PMI808]|nr:hypothetical protein GQ44DRAFT_740561 [Phaeosphaeriaceae sp. PMI808]